MSIGEAAAFLVLEDAEHCRARGGRVHARLAGYGMTTDAHHVTAPHPEGEGMIHAMEQALADAGLAPSAVGYVNAHGTGTPQNDRAEALALRRVFGEGGVLVSSTKSLVGHTMAAAGSVEAAATILALQHGLLPPTAGLEHVDPDVPVRLPAAHRAARRGARRPLSNSFGFGGQNVSLVFEKARPARWRPASRRHRPRHRQRLHRGRAGGRCAGALALGRSAHRPGAGVRAGDCASRLAAEVDEATLTSLVDRDAARRLSRICRLGPRPPACSRCATRESRRARARHRGGHRARRLHVEPRLRPGLPAPRARPGSRR